MDILRLRPIIRHVRVILRCDNYRQGKFVKFIKSKFKILTCVVLLRRLNTMRGISAGKYDKGNMNTMMREIWVRDLYIAINYTSIVSASHPPVTIKSTTNFSDIWYLLLKSVWSDFCNQAVFSKFMPRIFLCGRPYNMTANWQKEYHCF